MFARLFPPSGLVYCNFYDCTLICTVRRNVIFNRTYCLITMKDICIDSTYKHQRLGVYYNRIYRIFETPTL